jgi:hypothetical protein
MSAAVGPHQPQCDPERSPRRLGDCALAIAHLCGLSTPLLQCSRMTTPMKDREYPHFFFLKEIIDPIEFESMYRRPAHIRESDSVKQR